MKNLIPVIGLEIHVELNTKSKMFCQCDANYFGKEPNSNTCPVCLGMPGALPVPNKEAIKSTILIGKAFNCRINHLTKFDRKHYFYPDLPKGYQISQYDEPIAQSGYLKIKDKKFRIQRVHLEEDTGKLLHRENETLVDFNRSGVPLVEIVTEPDFNNSDDVKIFLQELHMVIRELNVSDADMEKGSMRLEPNISVKEEDAPTLPKYKVEVKNINSFNFVKKAVDYEIGRQKEILKKKLLPAQETRGFNEKKGITFSQRSKEQAHDYRYFPEPDIPPMRFTPTEIDQIKVPELPAAREKKYVNLMKSSDAFIIARNGTYSKVFEELHKYLAKEGSNISQSIANLIVNKKIDVNKPIDQLKSDIADRLKPMESNMDELEKALDKTIEQNKKAVEEFRNGKENVLMFLVGQVMKELKGKADANQIKIELTKKLK